MLVCLPLELCVWTLSCNFILSTYICDICLWIFTFIWLPLCLRSWVLAQHASTLALKIDSDECVPSLFNPDIDILICFQFICIYATNIGKLYFFFYLSSLELYVTLLCDFHIQEFCLLSVCLLSIPVLTNFFFRTAFLCRTGAHTKWFITRIPSRQSEGTTHRYTSAYF